MIWKIPTLSTRMDIERGLDYAIARQGLSIYENIIYGTAAVPTSSMGLSLDRARNMMLTMCSGDNVETALDFGRYLITSNSF